MHKWGGDHGSTFLILARRPHDSSPRGVDLAARDLWKLTAITIVVNAVLAVSAYWVFSFIRIGPLQLLFIWFPLYLAAALPHLIEKSVRPFWSSRPHYKDGSIVIPGNHQSIALITTGLLLYAFAGGTMAAGFTTGQPFHAALYVFAAASMAYLECSRNPGKDLVIALTDKQKTTLTSEGISFHFPELLSVEEDSNDRDVTILWSDNVTIDSILSPTIFLEADPTHTADRGASRPSASASPTPASTPSCGVSMSTPRTVHSWPHRKASTSSTTSSPRPTWSSQPYNGGAHEHQETHPRDTNRALIEIARLPELKQRIHFEKLEIDRNIDLEARPRKQ